MYGYLNENQKQAVLSNAKRLLIVAGAGSGKTKTLTEKVAYLLYNRISPENIYCITFTRYAANEMKDRLSKMNNRLGNTNSNRVFINTIHKLAMEVLENYGDMNCQNCIGQAEKEKLLKKISVEHKIKGNELKKAIINGSDKKNILLGIKDYIFNLKNNELFDIDLVVPMAIELLKDESIATKVRNKIKYLFIDEYQDCNSKQIQFIEEINPEYFIAIGDPNQSIYGWNGSDISYILNFKERYNAERIILNQNYRSGKCIINVSNKLAIEADNFYVEMICGKEDDTSSVIINHYKSEVDSYYDVIAKLTNLQGTVGILFRKNSEVTRMSNLLDKIGVKYTNSIKNTDGDSTISNILKLAINLNNDILVEDVLEITSEVRINSLEKRISLFKSALELNVQNSKHIFKLSEIIQGPALEVLSKAEEYFNYYDKELHDKISKWVVDTKGGTIQEYFMYDALTNVEQEIKENKSNINVMTIHACKGLEYDNVFLMNVVDCNYPLRNENIDESRRLLYVGITRAKKNLTICVPESIINYKNNETNVGISKLIEPIIER